MGILVFFIDECFKHKGGVSRSHLFFSGETKIFKLHDPLVAKRGRYLVPQKIIAYLQLLSFSGLVTSRYPQNNSKVFMKGD